MLAIALGKPLKLDLYASLLAGHQIVRSFEFTSSSKSRQTLYMHHQSLQYTQTSTIYAGTIQSPLPSGTTQTEYSKLSISTANSSPVSFAQALISHSLTLSNLFPNSA